MLPKVIRDDTISDTTAGAGVEGTSKVRMLSAKIGGGGMSGSSGKSIRRPISTKSAHVTNIPLEPTFLSPSSATQAASPSRPYMPYSPVSPRRTIRQNSHRVQQEQQTTTGCSSSTRWKGGQQNGYGFKGEHRARAHSHKNFNGKTWGGTRGSPGTMLSDSKSMPYLVPKSARQRSSSTSAAPNTQHASSSNLQQAKEEKVITKPEELQTTAMQLVGGGIVTMTGTTGNPVVGMNVSGGPASSSLTKDRVQVCRTKEEKEKNPDSIRLDKRGVRVFPDIGGGESTTLKLLSLQHNLITRLENVPLLSQLVVLDLYDNRVERITGLQGLPSLRVLLLGKNRIKRIEGLDSLKRLEILDLHGNQLRYVDNLAPLSALRVLNLAGNLLRNIRNLGPYGMSSLTELNIKRNRIRNLDGLQKAPHLKKLLIANNDLPNIASLAPLRKLFYLNELVIDPNPLVGVVGLEYQSQVLTLFPNLGSLDRNLITDDMKLQAKLWHKKKLQEEEARKQEEERLRQEMAAAVGPPGSREQVIYQARRRWESVKNFVKSNGNTQEQESSLKITKSAMKSVKKVVTVVTEVKAQKRVELLYPPSTLDLEEFPDGQQKLDQMESMISSQIVQKCTQPQIEKRLERDNLSAPMQSVKEPGISQITPIVSKVVLTVSPRENGSNNISTELEKNLFPSMIRNPSVIREESGEDASLTISSIISNDLPNAPNEQEEVQQQDIQLIENQCSARSNSAKVAVVRPLVRSDICKQEPVTVSKHPSEINVNSNSNTATSSSTTLNEINDVFTENIEYQAVGEVGCSSSAMENVINAQPSPQPVTNPPVLQEPLATSQVQEDIAAKGKDQSSDQGNVPQAVVPNEASRVKAKLLKHLRSISLDSYPHPFLRPDGHKPGDASSINSGSPMIPSDDDGDGGEEDDDNDNEVVQDYEDDDAYSITTSTGTSGSTPRRSNTVVATTNRLLKNGMFRKQIFPRTKSQRIKFRDRSAKLFGSTSDLSPRPPSGATSIKRVNSGTGTRGGDSTNGLYSGRVSTNGRVLRRCDSAASLSTSGLSSLATSVGNPGPSNSSNSVVKTSANNGQAGSDADNQNGTSAFRKQGMDFLVEVEGKMLNVFGQGGLRHALTAFASNVTCHVNTAKFHYISYDSIIPFFGKLRQVYPSLEHFHFRANNLCTLAQLDALSDLQGLTSLFIAKEGNPIVNHDAWAHYSSYRLSHWGLQVINGKEVCSEYRGGASPAAQAKGFESLGFLALSCLPQTALTPLAKRLHMLHCFCCCSPSTSSDESNRKLTVNQQRHSGLLHSSTSQVTTDHGSSGNFCTAWDDDPVLLDVIGKEALVYCPPTLPPEIDVNDNHPTSTALTLINKPEIPTPPTHGSSSHEKKRAETLGNLVNSGVEIVEKVDMLEKVWPTLLTEVIQEMLMDFRYMDQYMKKEIKKAQDITLINQQQHQHNTHHHHNHNPHGRKFRH